MSNLKEKSKGLIAESFRDILATAMSSNSCGISGKSIFIDGIGGTTSSRTTEWLEEL